MTAKCVAAFGLGLVVSALLALLAMGVMFVRSPARGRICLGFALAPTVSGWVAGKCLALLADY